MAYTQLISFDTDKGGKVPDLCLHNVSEGFGVPDKYGSAWIAWQHTQQHPDRNIPDGLDIPIYYSYTVDLGQGPQNYGHINVRLRDGRVWSDGNYYASIDAYMANHAPKFVGWGESVNDSKIIQEGEDMATGLTDGDVDNLLKDFALQPAQQDYDAARTLSNKDWSYYLQTRLKHCLSMGDVDNLYNNLGIPVTQADRDAVNSQNPKDFIYYFETQVKNRYQPGASPVVTVNGKTYVPKV